MVHLVKLPLILDQLLTYRYRDGTSFKYDVAVSPFYQIQYGIHLELLDKDDEIYDRIIVPFKKDSLISETFEANGQTFQIQLIDSKEDAEDV